MFFLPIRKLYSVFTRRNYSKPYQSLDAPRPRSLKRGWFMFILLVPAVYYIATVVIFSSPFLQILERNMDTTRANNNNSKCQRHKKDGVNSSKLRVSYDNWNRCLSPVDDITPVDLTNGTRKPKVIYFRHRTEAMYVETTKKTGLPVCVVNYTQLGRIRDIPTQKLKAARRKWVRKLNLTRAAIYGDKCFATVKKGGHYSPPNCISRHKVAVLVPYRNRSLNLAVFLYNIHPLMMNQKLEYRIFVLEQYGDGVFNKGRLYNAGFIEMKKYGKWKCVIFHDVDLIPLDDRILYTCPTYPRHMCGTVSERKKDPSFHVLFGGVTSMSVEHYVKVNGYSNMYWGWGGEDNDIFWRLRAARIPVVRYNKSIAEYTALPHTIRHRNKNRFQLLHTAMERYKDEGLSTVEYTIKSVNFLHLYTHIMIDVNPYNENTTVI